MAEKRKRILVPLDGSLLSEQIIPHVSNLVNGLEAEVVLLHICGPGEHQYRHMHSVYAGFGGCLELTARNLVGL